MVVKYCAIVVFCNCKGVPHNDAFTVLLQVNVHLCKSHERHIFPFSNGEANKGHGKSDSAMNFYQVGCV